MTFQELLDLLTAVEDKDLMNEQVECIVGDERFALDIVQSGTTSKFVFIPRYGDE